ncbi:MAG: DUF4105 domain-containing protein [Proteobacteria bacterium]|nr:MAG: DUF4105 domain-containing protein [Pseudomonadota bacterium]
MIFARLCLFLLLAAGSLASRAYAAEPFGAEITQADPEMDKVEIYLHTVNVGNMVYDNFGHTAIRVVDKRDYTDLLYNWGSFDFGNPIQFSIEFYKGNLNYKLGAYPYNHGLRVYRSDTRTVWEDRLLLTPLEKTRLLHRLKWNLRSENLYYSYQYFFDNCSTRPRDYINEAIGGDLESRYAKITSPMTYRDFVLDGYQYTPGMDVLLDFGMNSNIDRFATMWETMFHPIHLRSVLTNYSQNVRPILQPGTIIYSHDPPSAYPKLGYSFILLFGGVPLIPLGFWLYFQQDKVRPSRLLYRLFGGLSSLWLFFGGFFGFLMTLSWAVSGHHDLHHNANQLLCWPIDLLLYGLAMMIFLRGRPVDLKPKTYTFFRVYLMAHILISLLLPLLRVMGLIEQNVNRVSIYLLPPYIVILLLLFRLGIRNKDNYTLRSAPDQRTH